MCASIRTNNRCWNVKEFPFMYQIAKYLYFKISEFGTHYHQTHQMHRCTLPFLNRPYWRSFTSILRYWRSLLMIQTFHRVRDCKLSNYLIFLWIMRSFMNPVKKTLIGDTSGNLGDYSISLWFYQITSDQYFFLSCVCTMDAFVILV